MLRTRQPRINLLIRWAAPVAWMAFIFYLSAQPSFPKIYARFLSVLSLAGHVIEYAVLTLLLWWAFRGVPQAEEGSAASHAACRAFVVAVAYGISDELHQYFVPGRYMDPLDLLLDAIGAATALWVAGRLTGRRAANLASNKGRTSDSP